MSSVGLFGVQFNGWYENCIDRWCTAALSAGFDQIVLATDEKKDVPSGIDLLIVKPGQYVHPIPEFSNAAVRHLDTDWCWNMDVDNFVLPSALFEIRNIDAEVYQAGFKTHYENSYTPPPMSAQDVINADYCFMTAGSAFKKWMWENIDGYPDVGYQDWGLWKKMAKAGARFHVSSQPVYYYYDHKNSASNKRQRENLEEFYEQEIKNL